MCKGSTGISLIGYPWFVKGNSGPTSLPWQKFGCTKFGRCHKCRSYSITKCWVGMTPTGSYPWCLSPTQFFFLILKFFFLSWWSLSPNEMFPHLDVCLQPKMCFVILIVCLQTNVLLKWVPNLDGCLHPNVFPNLNVSHQLKFFSKLSRVPIKFWLTLCEIQMLKSAIFRIHCV